MYRSLIAVLACAVSTACSTVAVAPGQKSNYSTPLAAYGAHGRDVPLTGCDHPSGACKEIREAAVESYLYAQLAQNAYSEKEFLLPAYVTELQPAVVDDRTGFAARVYQIQKEGEAPFIVIAYRGTNFSQWADWWFGNVARNVQYEQGRKLFVDIRQKWPGTPIVLTGHSLGGAIAGYVSLREENAPIFVFNPSVRFRRGPAMQNERVVVSQYGEILAALRKLWINPGGTYTVVNCTDGGPFGRHTQFYLAECLTDIAAWEDKVAYASMEANHLLPLKKMFQRSTPERVGLSGN